MNRVCWFSALAGLLLLAGSCQPGANGSCPAGQARVGGRCIPAGASCGPGENWVGDTCVVHDCADFAGFPCQLDGGLGSCISGACLDVLSDSRNCLTYGHVCPPDTQCHDGVCTLDDGGWVPCQPPYVLLPDNMSLRPLCILKTCAADQNNQICESASGEGGFCCNGTCLSGDARNCGGCGIVCATGSVCVQSLACEPAADCATGISGAACRLDGGLQGGCCQGNCIDLSSDPDNCGACGIAAPLGETCTNGRTGFCGADAGCPPGTGCEAGECLPTTCSASSQYDYCVTDGGGVCCGSTCSPFGSLCGLGPGCHVCDPGLVCDGVVCVPPSAVSFSGMNDCLFGPPGQRGTLCGTACVADWEDPENCGACGIACPSGICSQYESSFCLPETPTDDCVASCGPNAVCFNGTCFGSDCANDRLPLCLAENGTIGICCGNGACAHPIDDPQNCGICGNVCPPGQACVEGACSGFVGCGPGQMYGFCDLDAGTTHACCPGVGCTDLMTDPLNCGGCGGICSSALGCVNGVCT